jgi:hypothetical protein
VRGQALLLVIILLTSIKARGTVGTVEQWTVGTVDSGNSGALGGPWHCGSQSARGGSDIVSHISETYSTCHVFLPRTTINFLT